MKGFSVSLAVAAIWPDRIDDGEPHRARAARIGHRASLRPWSAGGGYVNHLGDEKHYRVHEAYGSDT